MVKHKNRRWKIKTRKEQSEYGQDYQYGDVETKEGTYIATVFWPAHEGPKGTIRPFGPAGMLRRRLFHQNGNFVPPAQ